MPIRKVKQYSDRGSIKDLASGSNKQESEVPFLPSELRLKKLYEYAKLHNDTGILTALGFITTDYVGNKNALPLTAYRIKQIVADISSRIGNKIQEWKNILDKIMPEPLSKEAQNYINLKNMISKIASKKKPSFRRVA